MLNRRINAAALRAYERFIKLKGAPREIALGFSLGILIGMTPFIGAHILAGLTLASLMGWSKIAAIVGVNITNVLTAPLIYPINYWVGLKIAGISEGVNWSKISDYAEMLKLMQQSPLILADLCIGGMVLGIPLAVVGYFMTLRLIRLYRKPAPMGSCNQCSR